jgi:photosystem II stability/assembly factor-like uncharacterized protein
MPLARLSRPKHVIQKLVRPARAQLRLEPLENRTLLSWLPLGPAPILTGQTLGAAPQPVTGRVTAVAGDPTNANILYVATAGGGVWKTTDGGVSWQPLTDGQATLFMGVLAVAPSNPSVIYAGTGEADNSGDSFYGRGVLKSTDGGTTWTLLGNAQFDRHTISQLLISPTDPNVVYLAVAGGGANGSSGNTGVWTTTDGGGSWTNLTTSISTTQSYTDVLLDPSDPTGNSLYAAVGSIGGSTLNGVYRTTDGGSSWLVLGGGLPNGTVDGRIRLAASTAPFPTVLYASIAGSGQTGSTGFGVLFGVMKSVDHGATWTTVTPATDYMGGQGWYDTTLAVDPHNSSRVFVGGASIVLQTTNAGLTWSNISTGTDGNGPHSDHHGIGFDAKDRLLDGNDGGIWRLDNAAPGGSGGDAPDTSQSVLWTDLNGASGTGLQITQFVGIAQDPSNANIVYGGSQDNGREKSTGSLGWSFLFGGDGGFIRVDPVTPSTVYGEFQYGNLQRSIDSGVNWVGMSPPLATGAGFYSPFVLDPTNPLKLLFGSAQLWQSLNQGGAWTALATPGTNGFNTSSASIDAIATDGGSIYVSAGGHLFVTTNNGSTWTQRDLPGTLATIADLLAVPGFPGLAFAVHDQFGIGKVFFTNTFGATWTDITKNLPDLPAWCLAFDPSRGFLFAGLDNGVYVTPSPATASWSVVSTGLPHVQVTGLELNTSLDVLDAGTHGRGVFRVQLSSVGPNRGGPVPVQDVGQTWMAWRATLGSVPVDKDTVAASLALPSAEPGPVPLLAVPAPRPPVGKVLWDDRDTALVAVLLESSQQGKDWAFGRGSAPAGVKNHLGREPAVLLDSGLVDMVFDPLPPELTF